ncbi:MAG: putative phosphoenolpyruvate synthase [candidate division CPR2 bacterium GW2011_GWC2_39_10]|uniref:Putative phosphoenolpyruvate synthase n=1 Tax=candidate division CPR2 bacterium GW2011_GWC2_39_10 TaxID=1618345 RepID=A0A0G0M037_UNCC2|nr:MAG: putative phosphoenolpyruvate synthase [candidate division CPR2 bacterium GW2011_GWC2_39_10]
MTKFSEIKPALEDFSFSKNISFPKTPLLYFEAACSCHINNPGQEFLELSNYPNFIVLQIDIYESWQDKSKRPVISDPGIIQRIIDAAYVEINQNTEYLKNLTRIHNLGDYEIIDYLAKTNVLTKNIYDYFLYLSDECFATEDPYFITKLPQIRENISYGYLDLLWQVHEHILNLLEKQKGLSRQLSDQMLISEIIDFVRMGELPRNLTANRPVAFISVGEDLKILFNQEVLRLQSYLLKQDPDRKEIEEFKETKILKGMAASHGQAKGQVIRIDIEDFDSYEKALGGKENFILVAPSTRPEITPYLKRAKAIITDEGGVTCHAAIVSRELNIPSLVGTKVATQVFENGDWVELDTRKGIARLLNF